MGQTSGRMLAAANGMLHRSVIVACCMQVCAHYHPWSRQHAQSTTDTVSLQDPIGLLPCSVSHPGYLWSLGWKDHPTLHHHGSPPPFVQATVNDQKLMEPTPRIAWTRVLPMRCTVHGACRKTWRTILKTKGQKVSQGHRVLRQLGGFSLVVVIVALFLPTVCPVGTHRRQGYIRKALEKGYSEHPRSACCTDGMFEIFVRFGRHVCFPLPLFVDRQLPCLHTNSLHKQFHLVTYPNEYPRPTRHNLNNMCPTTCMAEDPQPHCANKAERPLNGDHTLGSHSYLALRMPATKTPNSAKSVP